MRDRVADLEAVCSAPEFTYWDPLPEALTPYWRMTAPTVRPGADDVLRVLVAALLGSRSTRSGRLFVSTGRRIHQSISGGTSMAAQFEKAWGYQGDAMALPVADVDQAVPFYERVMGFRSSLGPRDRIGRTVAGRDPDRDGRERRRSNAGRLRVRSG